MRSLLLSTVAAAALAAGMATASAQTTDTRRTEPGPQAQTQAPASSTQDEQKKGKESPRVVGPGQSDQRPSSQAPSSAQSDQKSDAKQEQKQSQSQDSKDPQQGQSQDSKAGQGTQQTQQPDRGKTQQNTTSQSKDSKDRATTTERSSTERSTQKRDDRDGSQKAARPETDSKQSARSGERAGDGANVRLSERQETTIRENVLRDRDRFRTNVNFSVSIGATVPRSVRLHALPPSIIAIVPQYRSYRFVVVEDQIVIIEPRTYRVVTVIPAEGRGPARVATGARSSERVQLSGAQRSRILNYARTDCTTVLAQTDFDLAIGASIPQQIELCPFEDTFVSEVSVVQPYRFFIVGNQVVLVDPRDHTIVEVIR